MAYRTSCHQRSLARLRQSRYLKQPQTTRMDLNEIYRILNDNLSDDRTLTLPKGALLSPPIEKAFDDYLLGEDLVLQEAYVENTGPNITVVGQGDSFPFANTYVTAIFPAPAGVAAMALDANGFDSSVSSVWKLDKAFPVLGSTFVKDLQFTAAVLTLRSSNASQTQPEGLSFTGTQELTGTLAVISKLLNGSNEVDLSGPIELDGEQDASKKVPVMVLQDPTPGSAFNMEFIFQLIDEATVVEKREAQVSEDTTKLVPVPAMQLVSRISVDTQSGRQVLNIVT